MNYPLGMTLVCSDGCNTCECEADGIWHATTSEVCFSSDSQGCNEGGAAHKAGETWICADGCNICTCGKDGTTLASTERACIGVDAGAGPVGCNLPPDTGPCKAAFPMFYFDPATGTCESFTYGGCDGNTNRFVTQEVCQATCGEGAG